MMDLIQIKEIRLDFKKKIAFNLKYEQIFSVLCLVGWGFAGFHCNDATLESTHHFSRLSAALPERASMGSSTDAVPAALT